MLGIQREILVDGKSYRSPAEMPADVRERYERALLIERSGAIPGDAKATFQMNGKEYASLAELPLPWRWLAAGLMSLARGRLERQSVSQAGGNLGNPKLAPARLSIAVSFLKFLLTLTVAFALFYWSQMRH